METAAPTLPALPSPTNKPARFAAPRQRAVPGDLDGRVCIDYKKLEKLISLPELAGTTGHNRSQSSHTAHNTFMKQCFEIFHPVEESRQPSHPSDFTLSRQRVSTSQAFTDKPVTTLESDEQRFAAAEDLRAREGVQAVGSSHNLFSSPLTQLRQLLTKWPVERSSAERSKISSILRYLSVRCTNFPHSSIGLTTLASIAKLEMLDTGLPVFMRNHLYLILQGSVAEKQLDDQSSFKVTLSSSGSRPVLQANLPPDKRLVSGDTLGSLEVDNSDTDYEERTIYISTEPTALMDVSSLTYQKLMKEHKESEMRERLQLLKTCPFFKGWPQVTLTKLAALVRRKTYPAGKVLAQEHTHADMIGFILSGRCDVIRYVPDSDCVPPVRQLPSVTGSQPTDQKRSRQGSLGKAGSSSVRVTGTGHVGHCLLDQPRPQVVVGSLIENSYFGQASVLLHQPMLFSVRTATHVSLHVIMASDLKYMDDIVRRLLLRRVSEETVELSERDILQAYLKQQKARAWTREKSAVVHEVITSNGMRPGYGKWVHRD